MLEEGSLWFQGINTLVCILPALLFSIRLPYSSVSCIRVNLLNIKMEAFVGSWRKDHSTVCGAEALGQAMGEFCYCVS